MRYNSVIESDIQGEFIQSLYINESVLSFDLRGNPGNTAAMKKQIALCLIKNLEQVKLKNYPIRPSWIELKLLDVENSDLNTLMQGLSIVHDQSSTFISKGGQMDSSHLNLFNLANDESTTDVGFQHTAPDLSNNRLVAKDKIKTSSSVGVLNKSTDISKGRDIRSKQMLSQEKTSLNMFHADLNNISHPGITDVASESHEDNDNFVAFKSSSYADLITAKQIVKAQQFDMK